MSEPIPPLTLMDSLRQIPKSGQRVFFVAIGLIVLLNILLATTPIPLAYIQPANILATIVLVSLPIFGLYRGADHPWTPAFAVLYVVLGVVIQFGAVALSKGALQATPMAAVVGALAPVGLMLWCIGLGALLATLLKDKNLLIPVSIFLAAFDIFLVLTPLGPTQKILQAAPQIFTSVAYTIPTAVEKPTHGPIRPFAYIGPADFVFMAMFFVAIYKYQMRAKQTLLALIPTLLLYFVLVFLIGPLPALVPIGLCVLAVNFKEFKLNKEEWASTAVIAAIAIGLIAWGATRPKPPAEPVKTPPVAAQPKSEATP